MVVGVVIYAAYGRHHSAVAQREVVG
jgi:hypothetical protein